MFFYYIRDFNCADYYDYFISLRNRTKMLLASSTVWKWIKWIASKAERLLITDSGPNKRSHCRPFLLSDSHLPFSALMCAHLFSQDKGAACSHCHLVYFSPLGGRGLPLQ